MKKIQRSNVTVRAFIHLHYTVTKQVRSKFTLLSGVVRGAGPPGECGRVSVRNTFNLLQQNEIKGKHIIELVYLLCQHIAYTAVDLDLKIFFLTYADRCGSR